MTARDRALIGVLSIVLAALCVAALGPTIEPTGDVGAEPSALPQDRPYVEGVLGHATNASPFGARSPADRALVALLFRGLVRLGPGDTIVPDLATRWEVDPTGARWTFHLRQGLTWDDGEPLTSDDVAFTVETLSDPEYTGPGAASWREVTASATDPLTVTLKLATPLGGFLQAATQPIAPAHLLGGTPAAALPDDPFGRDPIGSGPFRLAFFDASRAILEPATPLEAGGVDGGPNFATPPPTDSLGTSPRTPRPETAEPYLAGIQFLYYDDLANLLAAWDRGALDAASGLAPADAASLARSTGARLLRYPGTTLLAVELDLRPHRFEFNEPAERRALLQAIDRDVIVADVLAGLGVRADSLIPPNSSLFNRAASAPIAYDPAGAEKALAAVGWTKSSGGWVRKGGKTPLVIEILCPEEAANPIALAAARAVVAGWRAIGIDARAVPLPAAELLGERLHPGGFQAAVIPLAIGLDPDLYPLLASTQTRTGGANVAGLQDTALDKLLAAARAPGPAAKRLAAYRDLQAALVRGMYVLPLAFRDEVVVVRDTLTGPSPRAISTSGDRFWDVLTWRLADGR